MAKSIFQKLKEHKLALERGDPAAGHTVVGKPKVTVGDQTKSSVTKNGQTKNYK